MKSNEFRINNLLLKDNNIEKVAVINCDNTIRIFPKTEKENGLTYGCYPLSFFNPITLTEEWLLKFGYKEKDLEDGKIITVIENNKCIGFIINNLSSMVILKHVHQLQNLYFALTNNELEIL